MRYVTVRVVDSGGRPQSNAKVALWAYQPLSTGGFLPAQYTNSSGEAEFDVDDAYPEISVSVNGSERVKRGSVRAEYKIVL